MSERDARQAVADLLARRPCPACYRLAVAAGRLLLGPAPAGAADALTVWADHADEAHAGEGGALRAAAATLAEGR